MIAAAKPKISFPFFVGSAHLAKLKTPSRLRLDGVLTQILKFGEGGIRSQINFLTVRKGVSKLTVSVPRLDFLFVQKLQKMLNRASNPSLRHKQLCRSLLISLRSFGEGGIRTLDTEINPYNRLATCRLQPLGHLTIKSTSR